MLVMAGGFGTRLKSVVSDVPKPLAPINGTPFLHMLLENWVRQGMREFYFLLHYDAKKIITEVKEFFKPSLVAEKRIQYGFIVESTPLGTGGSVLNAIEQLKLECNFILANADTWLSSGIVDLLNTPSPSVAVVRVKDIARYGAVKVESGKITAFFEKNSDQLMDWTDGTINAGLYQLSAAEFKSETYFPSPLKNSFSLEEAVLPRLAAQNVLSAALLENAEFIDIGVPEDYYAFCQRIQHKADGVREPSDT